MNKEQSLKLFEEGGPAWNAWANEMLAERKKLETSGVWIEGEHDKWNEQTRAWHEMARADFSHHTFEMNVDFTCLCFPGDAVFEGVEFSKEVCFDNTEFFGPARFSNVRISGSCKFTSARFLDMADFWGATFMCDVVFPGVQFLNGASFNRAEFKGGAHFPRANFKGNISFRQAKFSDMVMFLNVEFSNRTDFQDVKFMRRAQFSNTKFLDNATFHQGIFKGPVYFEKSSFEKSAEFKAIRGKGSFSLYAVEFNCVPDFSEAHFEEAPLFDNVNLEPEHFGKALAQESETSISARWRALKRLAIQGYDHERELQFFKGEVIARRRTQDKLSHARFWVGWLYQILSDFGRSIVRPLVFLAISLLAFAGFYASQSQSIFHQPFSESATCMAGSRDPLITALALSVHNAVPFAARGSSNQLKQIYSCLYGIKKDMPLMYNGLPKDSIPIIPYKVAFAGVIQFFVSAVLIFLFVLAVRNYFRIR